MRIEFPTEQVVLGRVLEYKKLALYLCVGVTVLSLIVSYWMSSGKQSAEQFVLVEEALAELNSGKAVDEKVVQGLEGALKTHPELAGKVESILAQYFLTMKTAGEAERHVEKGFNRTAFVRSYYTDFARNSLLIEQEEYEQALTAAEELKQRMNSDSTWMTKDFGQLLFGFNLLRVAFLRQLLGKEEAGAVEEAKKFLEKEEGKVLLEHFSDQNLSILDYFNARS